MNQEAQPETFEESDDAAEETIEISHGEEGTSVTLDNVTPFEILALSIVAVVVLATLWVVIKRDSRGRGRHWGGGW